MQNNEKQQQSPKIPHDATNMCNRKITGIYRNKRSALSICWRILEITLHTSPCWWIKQHCNWMQLTQSNWLQHCLGRIPLIFSFLWTQPVRWSQSFQHWAIQNRNIPDYTLQDHLLNTCHKVAQLLIMFSTNWRHLAKFHSKFPHLLLSEVMFVRLSESLEAGKTPTSSAAWPAQKVAETPKSQQENVSLMCFISEINLWQKLNSSPGTELLQKTYDQNIDDVRLEGHSIALFKK